MRKDFLFAALLLQTPFHARADAPLPWKVGEKLNYKIEVGFLDAGTATLEVKEIATLQASSGPIHETYRAWRLATTAQSNSFVDVFYKVRDWNESLFDVERGVTHRFQQHNREGRWEVEQTVEFDWISRRFKSDEKVKGRDPKHTEGDLPIPMVDILSSLYLTRMKPMEVGKEFTLDVHSDRTWPLVVKVLERETVKTPAGKFDCFRIEPFLRDRGLFIQKGKRLEVWMTADERRLPVRMRAEIFIGHVTAELLSLP